MSRILQKLIKIDSPLFKDGLARLEKSTGNSGVDVRLIADVLSRGYQVMRELGLDTKDTTGAEIYHALMSSVKGGSFENLLINTDYVVLDFKDQLVSFNMVDVVENAHHQLPYHKQITTHGRRSLTGELVDRYVKHERTDERTVLDIFKSVNLPTVN
jgi:hypothetical protein